MAIGLDVVVRTLADAQRTKQLFRALDSIQGQSGVRARPIVVVNGERYDPITVKSLKQRPGVVLHFLPQPSAGRARTVGQGLATAEFLSFLDDDDVFIEGALQKPLKWLVDHPQCEVLITNGYFVSQDGRLTESSHLADHLSNPALSLLDENWLSPGASFFRTQSLQAERFKSELDHQEWTQLAFELCAEERRIDFMDVPTVLYYDTAGSMSKQPEHRRTELELLQQIRRDPRMRAAVRTKASRKYFNMLHILAMEYWQRGQYGRAWRYHLASMRPPHTFKYLLSSRKLLWPSKIHKHSPVNKS